MTEETLNENSVELESLENILVKENLELKNKLLYQMAEFENYKKRQAKLILDTKFQTKKDVILSQLSIVEDIIRSLKVEPTKGLTLVLKNTITALSRIGVHKMETINQKFDSSLHEAIATKSTDVEAGLIIEEIESGWYLDDQVIKYAKVIVSE
jgi:molecular chaperone GrpE